MFKKSPERQIAEYMKNPERDPQPNLQKLTEYAKEKREKLQIKINKINAKRIPKPEHNAVQIDEGASIQRDKYQKEFDQLSAFLNETGALQLDTSSQKAELKESYNNSQMIGSLERLLGDKKITPIEIKTFMKNHDKIHDYLNTLQGMGSLNEDYLKITALLMQVKDMYDNQDDYQDDGFEGFFKEIETHLRDYTESLMEELAMNLETMDLDGKLKKYSEFRASDDPRLMLVVENIYINEIKGKGYTLGMNNGKYEPALGIQGGTPELQKILDTVPAEYLQEFEISFFLKRSGLDSKEALQRQDIFDNLVREFEVKDEYGNFYIISDLNEKHGRRDDLLAAIDRKIDPAMDTKKLQDIMFLKNMALNGTKYSTQKLREGQIVTQKMNLYREGIVDGKSVEDLVKDKTLLQKMLDSESFGTGTNIAIFGGILWIIFGKKFSFIKRILGVGVLAFMGKSLNNDLGIGKVLSGLINDAKAGDPEKNPNVVNNSKNMVPKHYQKSYNGVANTVNGFEVNMFKWSAASEISTDQTTSIYLQLANHGNNFKNKSIDNIKSNFINNSNVTAQELFGDEIPTNQDGSPYSHEELKAFLSALIQQQEQGDDTIGDLFTTSGNARLYPMSDIVDTTTPVATAIDPQVVNNTASAPVNTGNIINPNQTQSTVDTTNIISDDNASSGNIPAVIDLSPQDTLEERIIAIKAIPDMESALDALRQDSILENDDTHSLAIWIYMRALGELSGDFETEIARLFEISERGGDFLLNSSENGPFGSWVSEISIQDNITDAIWHRANQYSTENFEEGLSIEEAVLKGKEKLDFLIDVRDAIDQSYKEYVQEDIERLQEKVNGLRSELFTEQLSNIDLDNPGAVLDLFEGKSVEEKQTILTMINQNLGQSFQGDIVKRVKIYQALLSAHDDIPGLAESVRKYKQAELLKTFNNLWSHVAINDIPEELEDIRALTSAIINMDINIINDTRLDNIMPGYQKIDERGEFMEGIGDEKIAALFEVIKSIGPNESLDSTKESIYKTFIAQEKDIAYPHLLKELTQRYKLEGSTKNPEDINNGKNKKDARKGIKELESLLFSGELNDFFVSSNNISNADKAKIREQLRIEYVSQFVQKEELANIADDNILRGLFEDEYSSYIADPEEIINNKILSLKVKYL